MHPNPIFRKADATKNLNFASNRAFGVLVVPTSTLPAISHIPFKLSNDGTLLEAHIVRSNPLARILEEPQAATMIVSGPDDYISPDWYDEEDQVPTWNYIAVHISGTLRRLEKCELRRILDELSADREAHLAPKAPWKVDKLTPQTLQKMMRQIIPIAMDIKNVEGTWKLSQNKSDADRKGVLKALDEISQDTIRNHIV